MIPPNADAGRSVGDAASSDLFQPVQVGHVTLANRIVMAPLTRSRAGAGDVPRPLNAEYYEQRATAGLIISEATGMSRQGLGWPYAPGIWNEAQRDAWRPVTDAVHEAGGRIVCQLWHMGRIVHSSLTGEQPVSASATWCSAVRAGWRASTCPSRRPPSSAGTAPRASTPTRAGPTR